MTNEELVLVALSGQPLDVAQLQYYTGIPECDLWVVLGGLHERGLLTEVLHERGLAVRFTLRRR